MVNNLVFRWLKPLFFMVLGAHGIRDSMGEICSDHIFPDRGFILRKCREYLVNNDNNSLRVTSLHHILEP